MKSNSMSRGVRHITLAAISMTGVLFMASACGGNGNTAAQPPTVRDVDEVLTEVGAMSDRLREIITWPGADMEPASEPPWKSPCASNDYEGPDFIVKQLWTLWGVPDSEMDRIKESVEEDLTGLDWEITRYERVNSRAQQFELFAQTGSPAEFGLHIVFNDRRDPGRTKEIESNISVRVQSSCYESAEKAPSAHESEDRGSAQAPAVATQGDPFSAANLDPRFGSTRKEQGGRGQ
jgi:hypothetical protein